MTVPSGTPIYDQTVADLRPFFAEAPTPRHPAPADVETDVEGEGVEPAGTAAKTTTKRRKGSKGRRRTPGR